MKKGVFLVFKKPKNTVLVLKYPLQKDPFLGHLEGFWHQIRVFGISRFGTPNLGWSNFWTPGFSIGQFLDHPIFGPSDFGMIQFLDPKFWCPGKPVKSRLFPVQKQVRIWRTLRIPANCLYIYRNTILHCPSDFYYHLFVTKCSNPGEKDQILWILGGVSPLTPFFWPFLGPFSDPFLVHFLTPFSEVQNRPKIGPKSWIFLDQVLQKPGENIKSEN